ncbi:MAG: ATP-dependent sacrificial sulfur transferase LarE [Calditrichaeota bacterium]|nr:MAG: ATP-dependent sacrificial sulfur transferase LarE [Calditrichota bacterium]
MGRTSPNSKYHRLQEILGSLPNLLVAYSGGVDSTFLLAVATKVLGDRARGIIGVSPSLPRRELEEALTIAAHWGLSVDTLPTREMDDPNYVQNPANRCYFCKKELFSEIYQYAQTHGFSVIADGTNADDVSDHRPGMQAARELQVRSPLKEAGLTKSEIRQLSREMGLPTWNKPEMACLASRFPTGTPITAEGLHQVEKAEAFLRSLGFGQLRVRHHGEIARIELPREELPRILEPDIRGTVEAHLKSLGYRFVTVDLAGYRRGSVNIASKPKSPTGSL